MKSIDKLSSVLSGVGISRKIVFALALSVFILVATYYSKNYIPKDTGLVFGQRGGVTETTLDDEINRDSDGDGLYDWEEALWGTDSENPDSNGNGIKDGDEVRKNQNTKEDASKLTETDAFARQFMAATLSLKQSGSLNQENLNKVTDSLINSINNEEIEPKYTFLDQKIVSDNEKNIKNYFNSIDLLTSEYTNSLLGGELTVVEMALKNNDEKKLLELDSYINSYDKLINMSIRMDTPAAISKTQLSLSNNFYAIKIATQNMKNIFSDPLVGTIGISQYKKYENKIVNDLSAIETYLDKNAIF